MAFLCSQLQVAVETQSQTGSCWNTDRRCRRVLPPPSGHAGQNSAIVLERLGAINEPRLLGPTERPPSSQRSDIKETWFCFSSRPGR